MLKSGTVTVNEVSSALEELGGEADSDEIKKKVISRRGADTLPNSYSSWESYLNTIDQLIHYHCPQCDKFQNKKTLFYQVSRGRYRLINANKHINSSKIALASEQEILLTKRESPRKPENPVNSLNDIVEEKDDLVFPEGKEVYALHRERERNPKVIELAKRNKFKADPLLRCEVCGFSFTEKYGELGKGFIEAHHTVPVSQLSLESMTKEKDICLVCPNCHRMLHRYRPWLCLEELGKIIAYKKL